MLEGDLGDFTLPEVLQLLRSTRKSGRLTLHGPAAVGRLVLAAGELMEVSADVARVGVTRRLLDQGLVGSAPIEEALRAADQLPGDRQLLTQLVARDALTADVAAEVARDQSIDQLAGLLAWEQGSFRFDRDELAGAGIEVGIGIDTSELLSAATTRRAALARIAAIEAAHHPGAAVPDHPATIADPGSDADPGTDADHPGAVHAQTVDAAPARLPAATVNDPAILAALDADASDVDDGPQQPARLVATVRVDRLHTDPTIDLELVSRLIDGVKEL